MIRKNKKSHFKQELRTAFLTYALVPVIITSLLMFLVLFFAWYSTMISQNQGINHTLSKNLEEILDIYKKGIREMGQDHRLRSVLEGKKIETSLYEDLYALTRQTGIHGLFHVLSADLHVIMSNTTRIPWYAAELNNLNLGILKAAAAVPGQVVTEINKQSISENPRPPVTLALVLETDEKLEGFLCIDLLYNDVQRLISRYSSVDIVLMDPFNNIAIATLPKFSDRFGKLLKPLQRNDSLFNRNNDHLFVSMNWLEDSGFSLLTITHTGVADIVIASTALFLIILFLVLAGILSVSAGNIAARKTVEIDRIVEGLQKIRQGNLDNQLHIERPEEFRIIGEAFNGMLTDIKGLMAVNAEEIRQNSLAEIRQLESHFNPHFLFNTLETIRYMINSDVTAAGQMILNLSSLLRYSISHEKNRVSLREDSQFITHYLDIQKCRFSGRFSYELQIDQQAIECYIPRLIVQPLIENSLKHGFHRKESLLLRIKGTVQNNSLTIDISDDGCGIDPEGLFRLKSLLECEKNVSGHHGLYNVHRRIRLMYGLSYGLTVESPSGSGTYIRLTLPAIVP